MRQRRGRGACPGGAADAREGGTGGKRIDTADERA